MITRRGFLGTAGAAAVAASAAGGFRPAAAHDPDVEGALGESIVAAKPALADEWSVERSAQIFGRSTPGPTWPMAEMLTFTAEADGATVARWLPPPLEATSPARVMVFVANYPMTKLGFGYREAALFLHAQHEGQEVLHCTWMVVDDDTALILGRETLGFPKKMAEIEADLHNSHGRVVRKGLPVLELRGSKHESIQSATVFSHPVVNVRGVPGQPSALLQMGGGETFHTGESLELEVSFGKSELDPLYRLGIGSSQRGMAVIVDVGVAGAGGPAGAEKNLTGTAVPGTWMMSAYPFRVW